MRIQSQNWQIAVKHLFQKSGGKLNSNVNKQHSCKYNSAMT